MTIEMTGNVPAKQKSLGVKNSETDIGFFRLRLRNIHTGTSRINSRIQGKRVIRNSTVISLAAVFRM